MKIKKLRKILIIVLVCVLAISIFNIVKITHDYKTADTVNKSLQEQFIKHNNIEPSIDPIPEEKITIPISVDFEALKKANDDIVGWIYCPDTPINYPVVKSKDNTQYLRADLNGKYLVSGTIFADYRNKDIGIDSNYIIYGHNMKNATMFGTLAKYKEQANYDAHPIAYFLTPNGNFIIELFAGAVVNRDSEIYHPSPKTDVIADIISKSTFDTSVTINDDDKIITLSTCSYEFNNARYVLLGKLNKI